MIHRIFSAQVTAVITVMAASFALPIGTARADVCPASANGDVSLSKPAKSNGVVEIANLDGSVKVIGWSKAEVSVKGSVDSSCQLDLSPSADRMRVRVVCPHHGHQGGELEIYVPAASTIEVKSLSSDASVKDVTGALRIESVSGDVRINGSPSEISVRTTSGDIVVDASTTVTKARSVSGEVRVRGVRGKASLESVSGECQLTGSDFTEAEMRTVSGEVVFEGALVGQGSFEFRTHSGDVLLKLPSTTNADFELRTFSGDLASRIGTTRTSSSALDFRLGNGGAKVSVRTFSADVMIDTKK